MTRNICNFISLQTDDSISSADKVQRKLKRILDKLAYLIEKILWRDYVFDIVHC